MRYGLWPTPLLILWIALGLVGCDDTPSPRPQDEGVEDAGVDADAACASGAEAPCADGCPGSVRRCEGGAWSSCERPDEVCDGADNDCDGDTDEGFPTLGMQCSNGLGACTRPGRWVCDPRGDGGVRCDAIPGPSAAETCNAVDDDCDGATDEGLDQAEVECEIGLGRCRRQGRLRCVAGGFSCDAEVIPPRVEICNALDDDCDGATDEGFLELGGVCTSGVGACAAEGIVRCSDDSLNVTCEATLGSPSAETCDGVDNDCDGDTDEGLPGLGEACSVGVGACAAEGIGVCGAGGASVECAAVPGEPQEESCNGVDDDCDGQADEGYQLGIPCEAGLGRCQAPGIHRCDPEGGVVCEVPGAPQPAPELCNEIDDDCDGVTDEGFPGLGEACSAGEGGCAVSGTLVCGPAGVLTCDAMAGAPQPELCNEIDDDCDGTTDEGFPGLGAPCSVGVGACAAEGVVACTPDGGAACDAREGAPRVEACNGEDDDCDGQLDENFPILGAGCAAGIGACAVAGQFICDGEGVVCDAAPGAPGDEVCNGEDDDCDGDTDEGFPGVGVECVEGVGACARVGVRVCTAQGLGIVCSAHAGSPSPEVCDDADNDCDGDTDEGFLALGEPCTVGIGACEAPGERQCAEGGASVTCVGAPGEPEAELCNGADDDCDGKLDEEFPPIGERCEVGRGACAAEGRWICGEAGRGARCDGIPGAPEGERCNGADDDCDGETDEDWEGLGEPCAVGAGQCLRAGSRVCSEGEDEVACGAEPGAPADEVCDGEDNDCDGETDEAWEGLGEPCDSGIGACARAGLLRCDGAAGVSCDVAPGPPAFEICNGEDDDCDGDVDEHVPALGTACEAGLGLCGRLGLWACEPGGGLRCDAVAATPGVEICAPLGLDEDCDGRVDEGCDCPGGPCPGACEPDDREPDDAPEGAPLIVLGALESLSFCDDGVDWRRLEARADVRYRLSAMADEGAGAVMVEVYDPREGGALVAADQGTGPGGAALIPEFRAPRDGVWWVRFSRLSGPGEGATYQAYVGLACEDDEYEPDDTRARARPLVVDGPPQLRTLCGGPDWASFEAEAGALYQIDAADLLGGADPYLELRDAEGQVLRIDRDSGDRLAARLWWQAQADGPLYVRVVDRPSDGGPADERYGGGRAYSLSVSTVERPGCVVEPACPADSTCLLGECVPLGACVPDRHEEDDTEARARAVAVGHLSALNHCLDDADWVRFEAGIQRYDVEVYGVRPPRAVELEIVHVPTGEIVAWGEPQADGARIGQWRPEAPGEFAVGVREIAAPGFDHRHRVIIREACLDDPSEPDNAPWLATPLPTNGAPVARQLCQEDWHRFEAEAGEGYTLELVGQGVVAEIRGRDGGASRMAEVRTGAQQQSRVSWAAPAAGTYYVRISTPDEIYNGPLGYTLTMVSSPVDPRCGALCGVRSGACGRRPFVDTGPSPAGIPEGPVSSAARVFARGAQAAAWRRLDLLTLEAPGAEVAAWPEVSAVIPLGGLGARGIHLVQISTPWATAFKALQARPGVRRVSPVYVDAAGRPMLLNDEVAVRLRGGSAAVDKLARRFGLRRLGPISGLPDVWRLVKASRDPEAPDALQIAAEVTLAGAADWAHPDYFPLVAAHEAVSDPLYPTQWHLGHDAGVEADTAAADGVDIRAHLAWPVIEALGAGAPLVAVFDDGFDLSHPDLPLTPQTVNAPANPVALIPQGLANHGTSVAGLVAARTDNGVGVAGVCSTCEVLPAFGATYSSVVELAQVFIALRDSGAGVINNSWGIFPGRVPVLDPDGVPGGPATLPLMDTLAEAIESAARAGRGGLGAVVVFSAGNGNEPVDLDPFSSAEGVIAVAAVADDGLKSPYSNFGQRVWISAPSSGGQTPGVTTTDVRGFHGYSLNEYTDVFGGTSAAAPLVAGAAGAILAVSPDLTAAQVKDILRRTARPIDPIGGQWRDDGEGRAWSPYYGYGLLDVEAAVLASAAGCDERWPDACVPVALELPPAEEPRPACAPCAFDGRCGGGCVVMRDEDEPVCLDACDAEGGCPGDAACVAGLCVPREGCAPGRDETCDGRDEDRDGHVDEGVCGVSSLGEACEVDAECVLGGACVEGRCRARCGPLEPCKGQGEACLAQVNRYGQPTGVHICLPVRANYADCLSACYTRQRQGLGEEARIVDDLESCIEQSATCAQMDACF